MKKRLLSVSISTFCLFIVIFIFSKSTTLSEWYICNIYPIIASGLSFLSAITPFSLYDLFIIAATLFLLYITILVVIRRKSLGEFIYQVLLFIIVISGWFYFGWGISYFREDFYTRCHIEEITFDKDTFRTFATAFINETNNNYTNIENIDRKQIDEEIEASYQKNQSVLKIRYPNGKRREKKMMYQSFYTKMGITGYFGPFFNEVHINRCNLNFNYPFVLAHEKAHQFGVASEAEANLYSFLVCSASNNQAIRYSAYISILRYILADIQDILPNNYDKLFSMIRPEVIDDLKANLKHWERNRNQKMSETHAKVYDSYLKTNKIKSGKNNYSEVVGLVLSVFNNN